MMQATTGIGNRRLVLVVCGDSPRSERARRNLTRALEEVGFAAPGLQELDVNRHPDKVIALGVFATPALIRLAESGPSDVLYGDLDEPVALADFLSRVVEQ